MDVMSVNRYETVTEAVQALKARGYAIAFEPVHAGLFDPQRGTIVDAPALRLVEFHRFEGETDPDDMAVVYVFEVRDGRRGYVIDAYGPHADPLLGELLTRLGAGAAL